MQSFSIKLVLLSILTVLNLTEANAGRPPNFIIIFCDDLGYGDLGCYGHPTIRTPYLDRLAGEGQRWTSFYVGASVCTPSRAALLTGKLPIRNGMMSAKRRVLFPDSVGGLPASETTIAQLLQGVGYSTAAVGKWHLGHLPEYLPEQHGFDSYWGIPYSNDMDPVRDFPNYRKQALKKPNFVAPIEQFNVPILHGTREIERPANQHTLTKRYTERVIDFIKANQEQPFFLYYAQSYPHIPLFAGKEFRGKSRRGLYGDVIEEIDGSVGQIVQTLEDLDLAKNTMVVFTSDNGPWLSMGFHSGSAGPFRQGKGTTYEGGMRVPTIFWWPDRIQPCVQMQMGATLDLLPTICSLADVTLPKNTSFDGYDLSNLLVGDTQNSPRQEIFFWREEELYAVRIGPWKAHFVTKGCYGIGSKREEHSPPLLYNLDNDPAEKYNLAAIYPDVVARIESAAATHKQSLDPVETRVD